MGVYSGSCDAGERSQQDRHYSLAVAEASSIAIGLLLLLLSGSAGYAQSLQTMPAQNEISADGSRSSSVSGTISIPLFDPAFRPAPSPDNTEYGKKLTGDWGGFRKQLHDWGVDVELKYTSESAWNPIGGKNQGAAYAQQVALGTKFDLEKLVGLQGGQVVVILNDRVGDDLKPIIGSIRSPQEVFGAGQNARLSELSYTQKVLSDLLEFKVGFAPVGTDFATSQYYCYFQSGMFCGHNAALSGNSGGFNYPTGQWGGRVKVQGPSDTYVQTGIYQVNPSLSLPSEGFDLGFQGTGVLVPIEFGWLPEHGLFGLPGHIKVGAYYDSSTVSDVERDINGSNAGFTGLPFMMDTGRYGAYALTAQTIYREPGTNKGGLSVFGAVAAGDPQTAQFSYVATIGILQQGIGNRDDDYIGFAVGQAHLNNNSILFQEGRNAAKPGSVAVATAETVYELDYGVQVTPWFLLRPNLQYIQRPGGTGTIPNAFVLGLTATVDF